MFKILVTSKAFGMYSKEDFSPLLEKGYSIIKNPYAGRQPTPEELLPLISEADGVIIGNDIISSSVFNVAKKLKVISKFGVGVDNIDLQEAKKHGVVVTNVPGTTAISVAEFAFGLMLDVSKLITYTNRRVMQGMWPADHGSDLYGKQVGIIGFGKIGQQFAKRAKAFGMNVVAFDYYFDKKSADEIGVEFMDFDTLIMTSDYVSLHIPKTPQTTNLINSDVISKMKKGSYLINAARGGIVDEEALYRALENKHLAGAGFDVLEQEPPKQRPKLFDCENFICTSHSGGTSKDAIAKTVLVATRNLIQVLENKACPNIVG
jgi:D-3-phosphoglycerate dehydrogenase